MPSTSHIMPLAIVAFAAPAVLAQHHGDILLTVDHDRIATSLIDDAGTITPRRVFASELGELVPDFADEPGFDSEPGTFRSGTALGFRIGRALRLWENGSFTTIPDEHIEIAFGPLGPVVTPDTDTVVNGFTISVGANGQWHRHLEYTLTAPAPASPDTGVYLLEFTVFSTDPSVAESSPFWIVFNQNDSEEAHDAAIEWAIENLTPTAPPCPADFNHDGFLDFFDYDDFVACFEGSCPDGATADFNGDGFADFFDYDDFVAAFEAGC